MFSRMIRPWWKSPRVGGYPRVILPPVHARQFYCPTMWLSSSFFFFFFARVITSEKAILRDIHFSSAYCRGSKVGTPAQVVVLGVCDGWRSLVCFRKMVISLWAREVPTMALRWLGHGDFIGTFCPRGSVETLGSRRCNMSREWSERHLHSEVCPGLGHSSQLVIQPEAQVILA